MRGSASVPRPLLRWLPFVAAFALLPACTTTVEPVPTVVVVPTESTGTLVIDWTIQSSTDPGDCALTGADSIRIQIMTVDLVDAGTYEQSCAAFATSIRLVPGTYQASARLIDAAGRDRTTSVLIEPFTVLGGDIWRIPIDFPADSFF